ncbi:MAG TPA: PfkB family carbohydrate kinase [Vicinamibacterales bacterium]|nr:PfkB family carbohydrate kinase [Vicinamibacterales bacterium]
MTLTIPGEESVATVGGAARWDVVGVGANSVDLVHLLPAFPEPEGWRSKMRIARRLVHCGGQVATTTAACARLGLRAKYVGVTGNDEHGRRVREALASRGIDLAHVVVRQAPNQFAVILIDEGSGERAVLWERDERLRLRDEELPWEAIASARLLHVDDVDPDAAIALALGARQRGVPVTSDLDRADGRAEELVAAVTVPVFTDGLPQALTGLDDREAALRRLRQPHHSMLCVTLGHAGALALDGDRVILSPGLTVEAVDTTGAGDIFRGGLIRGLLHGWETERTLAFANATAALSCTRHGALDSVPALAEVEGMLERMGPGARG